MWRASSGVTRFVLVSTDKAVAPATVMGASKALAEFALEAATARFQNTLYAAVRFGNVLGSSGSVVPIFRRQIERGGPVTVTDERMTRYFMTIPEAVQLIIRSGSLARPRGGGAEVFVLDMGEPVRIMELARAMIELSGLDPDHDIDIEVVGSRPGEKLHEELFNSYERPRPTIAEKILLAERDPLAVETVESMFAEIGLLVLEGDAAGLAAKVSELSAMHVEPPSDGAPPGRTGRGEPRWPTRCASGPHTLSRFMTATTLALSISSSLTEAGTIAALAALVGIAVLSLLVFSQAREIRRLREWAGRAPERAAEVEQRVSAEAAARLQQPAAAAPVQGDRTPGAPHAPINARPVPATGPATAVSGAAVATGAVPSAEPPIPGSPAPTVPGAGQAVPAGATAAATPAANAAAAAATGQGSPAQSAAALGAPSQPVVGAPAHPPPPPHRPRRAGAAAADTPRSGGAGHARHGAPRLLARSRRGNGGCLHWSARDPRLRRPGRDHAGVLPGARRGSGIVAERGRSAYARARDGRRDRGEGRRAACAEVPRRARPRHQVRPRPPHALRRPQVRGGLRRRPRACSPVGPHRRRPPPRAAAREVRPFSAPEAGVPARPRPPAARRASHPPHGATAPSAARRPARAC